VFGCNNTYAYTYADGEKKMTKLVFVEGHCFGLLKLFIYMILCLL